jgi:phenylalanyl-tRNA synthetase beta chain
MVEIQEKMHNSIGRKRKKIAIGIYPLEKISLPIRFTAKNPQDIKFIPLESKSEMNANQILRDHPTGREYAHILENLDKFPIFIDANNEILSMPPIINSEKTGRITESTKEFFIECSGSNIVYLKKCLNIILSAIYEMGGKIYEMQIKDETSGNFNSPQMKPQELEFNIEDVEKTLGIRLSEKDVRWHLARMGIDYKKENNKSIALIPCYRTDILHWIDLVEEIAISYGYENFEPEIPKISTIASENPMDIKKRIIGNILSGIGLLEVSSYHITSKKSIKKMHYDFKDFIELLDSKTEKDALRIDLLTNLLQIFSENSNAAYPQKIFEMGRVFEKSNEPGSETKIKETEKLSIALTDEKINFTELKQILDYLFKMINLEYKIENTENSNYIVGRCGKIIVNNKEIGLIGEIAPRVLKNWKIKMPVSALEMSLEFLE